MMMILEDTSGGKFEMVLIQGGGSLVVVAVYKLTKLVVCTLVNDGVLWS